MSTINESFLRKQNQIRSLREESERISKCVFKNPPHLAFSVPKEENGSHEKQIKQLP
jgi:hypothetical protein